MKTKNLLKQSIIQLELLKNASAAATKDSLLQALAEKVRNRLSEAQEDDEVETEQEVTTQSQDDQDIQIQEADEQPETQPQEDDQEDDQEDITLQDLADDLQPMQEDEDDLDLDADIEQALAELDLQGLDEQEEDDEVLQAEIDAQIQAQLQEMANQEVEQPEVYEQEVDEQLFEKIKGIIEKQMQADEDESQQKQVAEAFKSQVKQLTSENRKYKKTLNTIKKQLFETRMMTLKGDLAVKLFNHFNLNKKQKIKIIERFDSAYTQLQVKMVYNKLLEHLKSSKQITRKHKTNIMSNKISSTKTNKSTKSIKETKNPVDDSLKAIREVFKRKVGVLD